MALNYCFMVCPPKIINVMFIKKMNFSDNITSKIIHKYNYYIRHR